MGPLSAPPLGAAQRVDEREARANRAQAEQLNLEAQERSHIVRVLKARGWKIAGRDGAAAALGLHPNTLRSRMQRLRIPTRSDALRGGEG